MQVSAYLNEAWVPLNLIDISSLPTNNHYYLWVDESFKVIAVDQSIPLLKDLTIPIYVIHCSDLKISGSYTRKLSGWFF